MVIKCWMQQKLSWIHESCMSMTVLVYNMLGSVVAFDTLRRLAVSQYSVCSRHALLPDSSFCPVPSQHINKAALFCVEPRILYHWRCVKYEPNTENPQHYISIMTLMYKNSWCWRDIWVIVCNIFFWLKAYPTQCLKCLLSRATTHKWMLYINITFSMLVYYMSKYSLENSSCTLHWISQQPMMELPQHNNTGAN